MLHDRPPGDRHQRLGLAAGERSETRPLAAGHDDRLHSLPLLTTIVIRCRRTQPIRSTTCSGPGSPASRLCSAHSTPRLWESTRQNPVLLLTQLGEEGIAEGLRARRGQARARRRTRRVPRVLRPQPALHGRAGAAGHRVLLARVRPRRVPAHLLGRPRRARRRPPEGDQRPRPAAGRGRAFSTSRASAARRSTPAAARSRSTRRTAARTCPCSKVEGVEVEAPIGSTNVQDRGLARAGRAACRCSCSTPTSSPIRPTCAPSPTASTCPSPTAACARRSCSASAACARCARLGLDADVFHLNEGHSFLCAIERIRELRASRQMTLEEARLVARAGIVFTTHTPIAAGSDYFEPGLVWDLLGPYLAQVGISFDRFMDLGRQRPGDPRERLCTTYAALRLADQSVGVSRLHGAVSRRLWKDAWRGLHETPGADRLGDQRRPHADVDRAGDRRAPQPLRRPRLVGPRRHGRPLAGGVRDPRRRAVDDPRRAQAQAARVRRRSAPRRRTSSTRTP